MNQTNERRPHSTMDHRKRRGNMGYSFMKKLVSVKNDIDESLNDLTEKSKTE